MWKTRDWRGVELADYFLSQSDIFTSMHVIGMDGHGLHPASYARSFLSFAPQLLRASVRLLCKSES